uniref:Uncharacterized protein n=1 Tax=Rhodnius prolixus TaxID=13249 RepID=T1HRE3_RHOPR
MGLMLSVLVFCVGVLEALSCLEYIRHSYLPFELTKRKRRRRLIVDLNTGKARHVDAVWPSDVSHEHIIKKRFGTVSVPNSFDLEEADDDESVLTAQSKEPTPIITPEELQHALSAALFEEVEEDLAAEEEEELLLHEEETSEETTSTDDLTQIFKPIHSTAIMQPISDSNVKDITGPLYISTITNNNNLLQEDIPIEESVIGPEEVEEPKLQEKAASADTNINVVLKKTEESKLEPSKDIQEFVVKKTETLIPSTQSDDSPKQDTNQSKTIKDFHENQQELSSQISTQIPLKITSSEPEDIFTDTFSSTLTFDEEIYHDASNTTSSADDGETIAKVVSNIQEVSSENLLENGTAAVDSIVELAPLETDEGKLVKEKSVEKKIENEVKVEKVSNSKSESKKNVHEKHKQDLATKSQIIIEENGKISENASGNHRIIKAEESVKTHEKTESVADSSLKTNVNQNFSENETISAKNLAESSHISGENSAENHTAIIKEKLDNTIELDKDNSDVECIVKAPVKTESENVFSSCVAKEDEVKLEIVSRKKETTENESAVADNATEVKENQKKNSVKCVENAAVLTETKEIFPSGEEAENEAKLEVVKRKDEDEVADNATEVKANNEKNTMKIVENAAVITETKEICPSSEKVENEALDIVKMKDEARQSEAVADDNVVKIKENQKKNTTEFVENAAAVSETKETFSSSEVKENEAKLEIVKKEDEATTEIKADEKKSTMESVENEVKVEVMKRKDKTSPNHTVPADKAKEIKADQKKSTMESVENAAAVTETKETFPSSEPKENEAKLEMVKKEDEATAEIKAHEKKSTMESVENAAAVTETKETFPSSKPKENEAKLEMVKRKKGTLHKKATSAASKTNRNKNQPDTSIKQAIEVINKKEEPERRIIDIELVECFRRTPSLTGEKNDPELLPDGNVNHQTLQMKSTIHEIFDDNTIELKPSEPKKAVDLEKVDDPRSPDKAFWVGIAGSL